MATTKKTASAGKDAALSILLEASELAAGNTLDLDALLRGLAVLVRKVVDYELFAVMLPTDHGDLRIRHAIGYSEELVGSLRVPIGKGITGQAASRKKTIFAGNVAENPDYLQAVSAVQSEIAVPLVARGRLVALLDLQSAQRDAFGEREQSLLELIASRFSLAIDAARLYRAQARQNSTAANADSNRPGVFADSPSRKTTGQNFIAAADIDPLRRSGNLPARTRQRLAAALFRRMLPRTGPLERHRHGQGVGRQRRKLRRPVLVGDTSQDPRYIASTPGIRSEVAIPLILKNEVLGVLDLESGALDNFSQTHVHTLNLLAPQIAAAIENARLYEEKARNEERMEQDLAAASVLQRHLLPRGKRRYPEWKSRRATILHPKCRGISTIFTPMRAHSECSTATSAARAWPPRSMRRW